MTDDQTLRNIAANILRLLALHGISQNGLARDIGESPTRINQYAQGKKMPGAGVLSRIAEYFGVTTDELMGQPPSRPSRRKKSA